MLPNVVKTTHLSLYLFFLQGQVKYKKNKTHSIYSYEATPQESCLSPWKSRKPSPEFGAWMQTKF